ncbi:hypothetical protein ACMFMG_000466 [Clarireedia jacksonii]
MWNEWSYIRTAITPLSLYYFSYTTLLPTLYQSSNHHSVHIIKRSIISTTKANMSEDSIPKEYEGGEKILVTIADKDKNNQPIPEETQQKQLKEYVIHPWTDLALPPVAFHGPPVLIVIRAIKKAEEAGGYIYDKSSLYPGFSVVFKPGAVHALDSVDHVSTESADGKVTTQ